MKNIWKLEILSFLLATLLPIFFLEIELDVKYEGASLFVWVLPVLAIILGFYSFFSRIKSKDRKKVVFSLITLFISFCMFVFITSLLYGAPGRGRNSARYDAKRERDLREISFIMKSYYNENGEYPEINTTSDGRINIKMVKLESGDESNYIIPEDPGGGEIKDCNDLQAPYRGFDNTSDRSQYCIYACLEGEDQFFVASEKGTRKTEKEPNSLECW